jgi:GDPmannose 4,6-dehydratase
MAKTALITGVTGQDGGHLAKLLHEKGYDVYGIIRGQQNPLRREFEAEFPYVKLIEGDLTDLSSMIRAIKKSTPDEFYNLGAISNVGYSFGNPSLTADITATGVLNCLEAIRATGREKTTKFYQASTSELFGGMDYNRPEKGYTEESAFHPRSPYGVAKLYGHWITKHYREAYGIFAACGILFNHEGDRRGVSFVTRKITNTAARIKLGKQDHLELGNIDSLRDWGYAGDYVEGMWRILQQDTPDEFVLATGETHTVREFCELSFAELGYNVVWSGEGVSEIGTDKVSGKVLISINPDFYRPAEVDLLLGDPSKAERVLGWKRQVDFPGLVKLMVANDLKLESI